MHKHSELVVHVMGDASTMCGCHLFVREKERTKDREKERQTDRKKKTEEESKNRRKNGREKRRKNSTHEGKTSIDGYIHEIDRWMDR